MLIEKLLNVDTLRAHIAAKLVSEQKNRWWSNVRVYTYGRTCQYDPTHWDDVTELCRGLVVDWSSGEVLARPFRKFFNIETSYRPETYKANLPQSEPEVTRKMDGSLGILFRYENEVQFATRGSFGSSQARWATKFFAHNYRDEFPHGWTPLFEIIYPENRIVLKYDRSEMVLLAMVNIETGEEMRHAELSHYAAKCGMPVVELFNGKAIDEMPLENTPNEEGYVLTWHREGQSPLKLKVKFSDYVRIHRMVTGLSLKAMWEMMRDGITMEQEFGDLPDHFKTWAEFHAGRIRSKYDEIVEDANVAWDSRPITEDRKELALYFQRYPNPIPSICFSRLDGKDESIAIWKACRPTPEAAFITAVVEA